MNRHGAGDIVTKLIKQQLCRKLQKDISNVWIDSALHLHD